MAHALATRVLLAAADRFEHAAWPCRTQVVEQMTKLAKKGLTPSAIGVILRDQHGISQVRMSVILLQDGCWCCLLSHLRVTSQAVPGV